MRFYGPKTKWQGLASLEVVHYGGTEYGLSEYCGPKLWQAVAHSFLASQTLVYA